MRRLLLTAAAGLLLVLGAFALEGCKQGVGEICQIDDDCESGLECNAGTGRCQEPGADTPDAGPDASPAPDAGAPDASSPDASPADAMVDAS